MSKRSDRFIFHSKEAEIKDGRLRKSIVLTVLVSAVLSPLLTEGVLSVVLQFTDGDISLMALDTFLRYFVVILRYAALFTSYAAAAVGLVSYGYRNFKAPVLLMLLGSFTCYMIASFGSYIFCYENGLIVTESTVDVYEAGFNYFFLTVYSLIKNIVLAILCRQYVKRVKKKTEDVFIPDESAAKECRGFGPFMKKALYKKNIFTKISVYAALFDIVFSFTVEFFSLTLFQLLADGAPENMEQFWILFSSYALIIPGCVIGFFVMISVCLLLSLKKPEKKL